MSNRENWAESMEAFCEAWDKDEKHMTTFIVRSKTSPEDFTEVKDVDLGEREPLLIIVRDDCGSGGWALHSLKNPDEILLSGEGEWRIATTGPGTFFEGWDRPTNAEIEEAMEKAK